MKNPFSKHALKDYNRSSGANGSEAINDLDAIDAAVTVQNMTGDMFTSMYVLDSLLQ
jgi:hypothetical protein